MRIVFPAQPPTLPGPGALLVPESAEEVEAIIKLVIDAGAGVNLLVGDEGLYVLPLSEELLRPLLRRAAGID